MPTLKHPPDSNVTPEPPVSSSHYYLGAASTHIYLAVVAVAILVAIRLAKAPFGSAQRAPRRAPKSEFQGRDGSGPECRKDSAASYSERDSAVRSPWEARDQRGDRLSFGRELQQLSWTAGHLPLRVGPGLLKPAGLTRAMDGIDEDERKDQSEGPSAPATSRGVSTSDPRHQQNPPPSAAHPVVSSEERRRGSRSPHSPPRPYESRRPSGGSDGAGDKAVKGKGPMVGHSTWGNRPRSPALGGEAGSQLPGGLTPGGFAQRTVPGALDSATTTTTSSLFARPPLPPPLTPPVLSDAVFPFEERRRSYAVSIPPELDTSFTHQPNPDYASGSTSTDLYSSSPKSATATPRRRSYTRSIPIGIPATSATASSSTETMTSGETFSPSSYPPTSPLLPPPPPGHEFPYEYEFVGGPGGPGILDSLEEVDVHGEIISVLDDAGHGWKRHTRVYGGGVCLACAAAGTGEEGGFYGDKVPLEDRRR